MSDTTIRIDIGDWIEDYQEARPDVSSDDAIRERLQEPQYHTGAIARYTVSARHLGDAPEDILQPNKFLLYSGARAEVAKKAQQKTEVEIGGKTFLVRELIGFPYANGVDGEGGETELACMISANGQDGNGASFVSYDTDEGLRLAENYLLSVLPGHIWNRLVQIAAHPHGDVVDVAGQLHAEIDDMVNKLCEQARSMV